MIYELNQLLASLEWVILIYFLMVNGWYGVLLCSAITDLLTRMRESRGENLYRLQGSANVPFITVLAPAYNEEGSIVESLRALLALQYPRMEIVMVDDGSRDRTLEIAREAFDLAPITLLYDERLPTRPIRELYRSRTDPRLIVAGKVNGKKADALNAALNLASGELACAIDADTLIESDALQRMVRPFLRDRKTVAAGGTVRIANGSRIRHGRVVDASVPRHPLAGFQAVEYLRAFLFGRLGWNRLGGNLIISGAFGLFDREALVDAGGWAADSIGEDLELVVRLRRRSYERGEGGRVAFLPDPVAWTEAPERVRTLGRQRERWHRGLADSLFRHRSVLFNPRYGGMGMLAFPYFVFVELLAPVVEMVGLIGMVIGLLLGSFNSTFAVLFLLAAYGTGIVLTVATLAAEEIGFPRYRRFSDLLVLLFWTFAESFGYRQMTVFWRIRGLWGYLRGRKDWGEMEKRGLGTPAGIVRTVEASPVEAEVGAEA